MYTAPVHCQLLSYIECIVMLKISHALKSFCFRLIIIYHWINVITMVRIIKNFFDNIVSTCHICNIGSISSK